MKVAYWGLLAVAITLIVVGHFANVDWLIFVAIAMILAAAALGEKQRQFFARKH